MSVLIPLNKNKSMFEGILEVDDNYYHICIEKSTVVTRFSCDWRLRCKLQKHLKLLEDCLCQCSNVDIFFNELKLLLQAGVIKKKTEKWHINYYDNMLCHLQNVETHQEKTRQEKLNFCQDFFLISSSLSHEDVVPCNLACPGIKGRFYKEQLFCLNKKKQYKNLGWEKISNISDDFREIQLKACDAKEREHILNIKLSFDYPNSPPLISATLPIIFEPLWTSDSDISIVYNQFKLFIQQFERFWNEIDELLEHTWILEPESPNFSATSFRIALDKTSSIQVKVDPLNMGVVPECTFLGAEWAVSTLRDKFHSKYHEWNEHMSLYQNLKHILERNFPGRQLNNTQDVSLQCGICYAYRLGVSIPDQICSDKRCYQPYHHECLVEWLKSVSGSKQSFNIIFGECPYCTSSIKVNVVRD